MTFKTRALHPTKTARMRLAPWPGSPMGKPETIYFRSNFGVEECLRRIHEATGAPKSQFFFFPEHGGSKPVFAQVQGNRIKLWKRRESRNDFAPCFLGVLTSEASGARLIGRFGMGRSVRLVMSFWLIFAIAATLATLPALAQHLAHPRQGKFSVYDFIPLGLVIFGILTLSYGRRIGTQEEGFLLEFLETTLQARQEDSRFFGPTRNQ